MEGAPGMPPPGMPYNPQMMGYDPWENPAMAGMPPQYGGVSLSPALCLSPRPLLGTVCGRPHGHTLFLPSMSAVLPRKRDRLTTGDWRGIGMDRSPA